MKTMDEPEDFFKKECKFLSEMLSDKEYKKICDYTLKYAEYHNEHLQDDIDDLNQEKEELEEKVRGLEYDLEKEETGIDKEEIDRAVKFASYCVENHLNPVRRTSVEMEMAYSKFMHLL